MNDANIAESLIAMEFGFKGHEAGKKLEAVREDFLKIWNKK